MAVQRLNLTRDQLASFLQDFEQIKQFERLFSTVDTISTVTLDEISVSAGNAMASATEALAIIEIVKSILEYLELAPAAATQEQIAALQDKISELEQLPPPDNTIASILGTFTAGSVIFAGASGTFTQNNANFFWDNTNNFLGIKTAVPAQPLDVNGVGLFGELATKISIGVNGDAIAADSDFYIRTSTANPMYFGTNSITRMTITSAGNVGIGTVTPAQPLDVNGVGRFGELATKISIGLNGDAIASDGDFYIRTTTASPMYFGTNSISHMTVSSTGNIGIGTTVPGASAILDVQSTTKGVRMPNMTTTQKNAITSPAAGLMVFDTTLSKLCVYSGAAWQTVTSV